MGRSKRLIFVFRLVSLCSLVLIFSIGLYTQAYAKLKNTHPRLVSQEWINKLTEWSNDSAWEPWQRFKAFSGGNFGDTYDAGRLFAKSLMWKIGKGNSYLADALNNFDEIVEEVNEENVNDIARKAMYIAYAYDLLYDQLSTSSQRYAVDRFVEWQETIKKSPDVSSGLVFWNYAIEKWVPAFVTAAAGAYDPSNLTNDLEVDYEYWKTNYFNPALEMANKLLQGAMIEGTFYGTTIDADRVLHAAEVIYNVEEIDIFNQNDWFSKRLVYEWQTYSIPYKFSDPTSSYRYGWYYHAQGHSERLRATVPLQARLNILHLLTRLPNHPYRGQIYSYLYHNTDPDLNKCAFSTTYYASLWAFLFGVKDLESQAVTPSLQFWYTNLHKDLPFDLPDYVYGPGYVFMRTGYTPDDIYISIKCGDYLNRGHDNLDEGTFELWAKGEDLAIHSGAYDGSGEYSQTSDYYARTVSMNGIIIYDPSEKFFVKGSARDNDGGQRSYFTHPHYYTSFDDWLTNCQISGSTPNPPGANVRGKLLKADHLDNKYTYIYCDVTRAYNSDEYVEGLPVGNSAKIFEITREFALVGNKYFIVFDRVVKKQPTNYDAPINEGEPYPYQDKWLLHTQTNFIVDGKETIVSDGEELYTNSNGSFYTDVNTNSNNARLYGKAVYPYENFQIRCFNGAKRYWNYQKNVPVTGSNWYGIDWGADRIEIEATDTETSHNYLVVLYPAGVKDPPIPPVERIGSFNMQGVLIMDTNIPQIVLFSKDGSEITQVAYDVTYTGTGNHLITGLEAGTYDVYKDGKIILANISVYRHGTLFFESYGGYTFRIVKTGEFPDDDPPAPPTGLRVIK